jgi:hypothetical protein
MWWLHCSTFQNLDKPAELEIHSDSTFPTTATLSACPGVNQFFLYFAEFTGAHRVGL